MPDQENIISKLEKGVQRTYSTKTTVFKNGEKVSEEINTHREPSVTIPIEMADKILALLKEQDFELSYRKAKAITHNATRLDAATCPSCGNVVGERKMWGERKVFIQWKYCIFCGQKLDWESR